MKGFYHSAAMYVCTLYTHNSPIHNCTRVRVGVREWNASVSLKSRRKSSKRCIHLHAYCSLSFNVWSMWWRNEMELNSIVYLVCACMEMDMRSPSADKKTDWELSVARKLQLDRWPVTKPKVIEWRIEISYAGSHFFVLFSLFIHPNNIHNRMALNALYAAVPANEISSVHRPTSPLLSPTGRSTVIAYSLTSTIPAFLYYKCRDKVLEPGNNASSIFFFSLSLCFVTRNLAFYFRNMKLLTETRCPMSVCQLTGWLWLQLHISVAMSRVATVSRHMVHNIRARATIRCVWSEV